MTMWGPPASAPWCSQHSRPVVTYPHNGAILHREPDFIDTTRHSSTYYGSSQQPAFIPRNDPARNQRPGSPFYVHLPPAQIHGSRLQNHPFREQAALPPRPLRAAPGENPRGNQQPGTYAGHAPRHGIHHQNRSRGPYPSHSHILLRQQDVGHQQANPRSNALHPYHGIPFWSTPSTAGDHGFVSQMAWLTQAAAPAQPQGPHINEAATMLFNSSPVIVPEATAHGLSPGTQPAGTPTLQTEASPDLSQPMTGPCPDLTCNSNQIWGRKQELERHVLSHLPHHICCPHPRCGWRGNRRYALTEHYKKKHPKDNVPDAPEEFIIYDAKLLAKRLVNGEITMASAINEAETLVRIRQGRLDT